MKRPGGVLTLAVAAGVLVGALGAALLVARHYNRLFEGWYLTGVMEQAHIARRIEAGEGPALAQSIAAELPQYARDVVARFGDGEQTLPALWTIRDYYRATSKPMPADLAVLLDELPPKPPGCCDTPSPELD